MDLDSGSVFFAGSFSIFVAVRQSACPSVCPEAHHSSINRFPFTKNVTVERSGAQKILLSEWIEILEACFFEDLFQFSWPPVRPEALQKPHQKWFRSGYGENLLTETEADFADFKLSL